MTEVTAKITKVLDEFQRLVEERLTENRRLVYETTQEIMERQKAIDILEDSQRDYRRKLAVHITKEETEKIKEVEDNILNVEKLLDTLRHKLHLLELDRRHYQEKIGDCKQFLRV